MHKSQKGGFKLCSMGYAYVVDKPKLETIDDATKVYWKCEKYPTCLGRAISDGLNPPIKHTKQHRHYPNPDRIECLEIIESTKELAIVTNYNPRSIVKKTQLGASEEAISQLAKPEAIKKLIRRQRNRKFGKIVAKTILDISIPRELHRTYSGDLFYYSDSGQEQQNRTILFTTKSNLELLSQHNNWYMDGTFDISPSFFRQVYTIHIIINRRAFPMAYALLANKKAVTYRKLFKTVKKLVSAPPNSITFDFELAAINSAKDVFKCDINCCYFHLSQAWFRRVQTHGMHKDYFKKDFLRSFKMLQAVAYLPTKYTTRGFEIVKENSPYSIQPLMDYFEQNYVGNFKKFSKTERVKPRFESKLWSVHERVKLNLPRTTNSVEAWHGAIQSDEQKHLIVVRIVELFREEESKVRNELVLIKKGETISRPKQNDIKRDKSILKLVSEFNKDNILQFLEGIKLNLED